MNELIGVTVTKVRFLTDEERECEGWDRSHISCIEFSNGWIVYASRDEEGNGPGQLFGSTACAGKDEDGDCDESHTFYVEPETSNA